MAYIYKITNNINKKVYIGQTINLEARWYKHKYLAKTGFQKHLYNAMRKYGIENFGIEVIEECLPDQLNERESFWILHYNSTNPQFGYNKSFGGEGGNTWILNDHKEATSALLSSKLKGRRHSDQSYRLVSEKLRGRIIPYDQRAKISSTLKDGYRTGRIKVFVPPHYDRTGEHHTDISKQRMSVAKKGKTYDEIYKEKADYMRNNARNRFLGNKNPNYKDIQIEEVIELIKQGKQLKEIANMFDVRYQTLSEKLKRMGLSVAIIRKENGIPERIRNPYGKRK